MVLMGNTKGHQYVWQILFQRSTAQLLAKTIIIIVHTPQSSDS